MRDLLETLESWRREGVATVLARVVAVSGSGPRDPGATLAMNERGEVIGSVSGGCVEGAVVEHAREILDGAAARLVSFGYSDDEAFAVGLTCGGTVTVFLEPAGLPPGLTDQVSAGLPVALATVVEGPTPGAKLAVGGDGGSHWETGSLGHPDLDRVVSRDLRAELDAGSNSLRHYGPCGQSGSDDVSVFLESFAPPPRMLIFGAVDFTAALADVAKLLGFEVTVCDAREVFATSARFPSADRVVVDWPHRLLARLTPSLGARDAVCVLTHDPKFDIPALIAAFGTEVGYLGAMGSRRTHAARLELLLGEGATAEDLARIRAPIGLDLGARSPAETAVAICAEIISDRTGRPGGALRTATGPIH